MLLVFIFIVSLLVAIVLASFSSRDLILFFKSESNFNYGGVKRSYLLSPPIENGDNKKLIVALHGYTDNPKRFAYYTALHNSVSSEDIVVYPRATKPSNKNSKPGWNSGFCCGSGWQQKSDDVGFIKELTLNLISRYKVNKNNVHILGFSNGAFMAQRLIIDEPDLFKAAVIASGAIGTEKSRLYPSSPANVLLIHGAKDTVVNYDGGVSSTDADFTWLSFKEEREAWQKVNEGFADTTVHVYPDLAHRWNDWRVLNFWNKTSEESDRVYKYFDSFK